MIIYGVLGFNKWTLFILEAGVEKNVNCGIYVILAESEQNYLCMDYIAFSNMIIIGIRLAKYL